MSGSTGEAGIMIGRRNKISMLVISIFLAHSRRLVTA